MDALPFLMLVGYGLASWDLSFIRGRSDGSAALYLIGAQVAGAMLIGLLLAETAVAMAAGGLGAIIGHNLPLRLGTRRKRQPYGALVAGAVAMAVLMPRAMAVGLIVYAVAYTVFRRVALSGLVATFFVPWIAWWWQGSDLFLLFGMVVWLVIFYRYLDRAEIQLRERLGRPRDRLVFRQTARRVAALLAVAVLFALFFLNRYVYHGFGLHPEIFRRGSEDLPFIALTFDDGPDPAYTPEILDILAEKGVRATFFVVGRHVDQHPEILRRTVEEGHEVGSHTYFHVNLLYAGEDTVRRELERTQTAMQAAAGVTPRLFRPPRGLYNEAVVQVAHEMGYTISLWSLSSQDWLGAGPSRIVRVLSSATTGGEVLLFHDSGDFITADGASRENTVRSLGPLIDALEDEGYQFVTVTELMAITLLTEGETP